MNYEYKYEKIKLHWFASKPSPDYHDIIAKHAKDGWRFVQIFAPGTGVYGSATYFELIFPFYSKNSIPSSSSISNCFLISAGSSPPVIWEL